MSAVGHPQVIPNHLLPACRLHPARAVFFGSVDDLKSSDRVHRATVLNIDDHGWVVVERWQLGHFQ